MIAKFGITEQRKDKKIQPTTLIQLSGGIDSAYVIWDWLKKNPDEVCLIHHINLINHEGRYKVEQQAVYNILSWLDAQGLTNYIYLENTFNYGNLSFIIKDVELCGFHIGIIVRNPRWEKLKKVLLPIYNNETKREGIRRNIIKELSYGKKIELQYPLRDTTKKEVINKMPKELFEKCWYCRTPNNFISCGNCKTCKEVLKIKNGST
jgi:hypothetical protein